LAVAVLGMLLLLVATGSVDSVDAATAAVDLAVIDGDAPVEILYRLFGGGLTTTGRAGLLLLLIAGGGGGGRSAGDEDEVDDWWNFNDVDDEFIPIIAAVRSNAFKRSRNRPPVPVLPPPEVADLFNEPPLPVL